MSDTYTGLFIHHSTTLLDRRAKSRHNKIDEFVTSLANYDTKWKKAKSNNYTLVDESGEIIKVDETKNKAKIDRIFAFFANFEYPKDWVFPEYQTGPENKYLLEFLLLRQLSNETNYKKFDCLLDELCEEETYSMFREIVGEAKWSVRPAHSTLAHLRNLFYQENEFIEDFRAKITHPNSLDEFKKIVDTYPLDRVPEPKGDGTFVSAVNSRILGTLFVFRLVERDVHALDLFRRCLRLEKEMTAAYNPFAESFQAFKTQISAGEYRNVIITIKKFYLVYMEYKKACEEFQKKKDELKSRITPPQEEGDSKRLCQRS